MGETICKKCQERCDPYDSPCVRCIGDCEQSIHIACLKRGGLPTLFAGDVFFNFECENCSVEKEQIFTRYKMSWLNVIILTMYHLKEKHLGISRRGYFHWKTQIAVFISDNWDSLFPSTVKKRKQWVGTISGILSHHSGIYFESGFKELETSGYWKLIGNDPPEVYIARNQREVELKKKNQKISKGKVLKDVPAEPNIINNFGFNSNANLNGVENMRPMNNVEVFQKKNFQSHHELINTVKEEISEDLNDFFKYDMDFQLPSIEDFPALNMELSPTKGGIPFPESNFFSDDFIAQCLSTTSESKDVPYENMKITDESSDIMDVKTFLNFSNVQTSEIEQLNEPMKCPSIEKTIPEPIKICKNEKKLPKPLPSLFTPKKSRPWPWDESFHFKKDDLKPMMNIREEEFVLQKIEQYKHLLKSAPTDIKRLYRKLAVRRVKRQYGLPILNIDNVGEKIPNTKQFQVRKKGNAVLDRFVLDDAIFFEQRLQGAGSSTPVYSTYTSRLLQPYIRRDTSSHPLWLKVTDELIAKVNKKKLGWRPRPFAPIDYSYIRPQHIPAINCLCSQFFWPGIDLTECLNYPDFTCVVLYKKLVIGFAIMVPDVGFDEAYISFLLVRPEWRNAGIGTFMIYHLIQTCMGKDITLHVSASNPAVTLYQKFGFKQEEFVQDFYEKYIPPSSKESKHALFLRLSR
ncbi:unnamed protein product [Trichogramma brassicae]|uniref:N-acetyltransferase domain-containing protein n=1 Tax=Trichogramma brassicae TaxID=86971 RepID=A0A6H5I444_9HYME|nr:unnamed protein product [Trichogramma brassicae]